MKSNLPRIAGLLLSLAGSCALLQSAEAQFTNIQSRDLIVTFRKTGADGSKDSSPIDFEVDIGQASTYYGAGAGSTLNISQYTASQLAGRFDSLNDLSWSVSGCVVPAGDGGDASKPPRTLWLTDPRSNPNALSAAWVREGAGSQGSVANKINSIMIQAANFGASFPSNPATNSATAGAIPISSGDGADSYIGPYGNYDGTFLGSGFSGDVENTTPATFTLGSTPSRSDFYELQPGSGAGAYLGYFELSTSGALSFHAGAPLIQPTLTITSDGTYAYISFPSQANVTYTLYSTTDSGLVGGPIPGSGWTNQGSQTGTGSTIQFQQTLNPNADTYFGVTARY
jgi:hypothetical protein